MKIAEAYELAQAVCCDAWNITAQEFVDAVTNGRILGRDAGGKELFYWSPWFGEWLYFRPGDTNPAPLLACC